MDFLKFLFGLWCEWYTRRKSHQLTPKEGNSSLYKMCNFYQSLPTETVIKINSFVKD